MKKRVTSLVLLLVMLLSSMAPSCAQKSNSEPKDTSAAVQNESVNTELTSSDQHTGVIRDDLPDADFNGYKFRIFSYVFIGRELGEYITYEELTGDVVNDALYNSTIAVEDRFNCDISIIRNSEDIASLVKSSVNAGDDAFDIQIGHDCNTANLSKEGMFINLFDVPQFNFEKPWWPKRTVENLSILDKLYIASSYLSFCGLHYTRVLVINKDKMEEMNMEMPYQMVLDGKWTLDEMIAMVENAAMDLDGNGKMDKEDFYGFATGDQTWYCMQDSVDLAPYKKDKYGIVSLSIDLNKADKYVEKIRYLINDSGSYTTDGMFGVEPFRQGRALMAYSILQDVYDTYRESEIRYGIIPTPKFDENQKEYISSCTDTFWAIPVTAYNNLDKIGTIVEALSCENYNNVIPAYFETALSKKLADAPEDAAMLNLIRDTRTIGFAYAFSMPFANIVADTVNSKKEFASYYASKEKQAMKSVEKLMEQYEEIE